MTEGGLVAVNLNCRRSRRGGTTQFGYSAHSSYANTRKPPSAQVKGKNCVV